MKVLLVLLMLLIPSSVFAEVSDTLLANGIRVLAQDWGQTKSFRATRPEMYEQNVILGKYPKLYQVDRYFAIVTATYIVASKALPEELSEALSMGMMIVEGIVVARNASSKVYPEWGEPRRVVVTVTIPF